MEIVKNNKKPGGPLANWNMGAEAEIIVRGPDGKIKHKQIANNVEVLASEEEIKKIMEQGSETTE